MYKAQCIVGIIPVRGGSVEVPRKNLRLLAGKPLLWYSLKVSQEAPSINHLFVSTEDDEIADYASSMGVEVIRHPPELSSATASTYPVIKWALEEIKQAGFAPDICVMLRATSPLRTKVDIDRAVKLLQDRPEADSVVSVALAPGIHPIRLKTVVEGGWLVDSFGGEGFSPKRRQELDPVYIRNGAIYAARTEIFEKVGLWGQNRLAYIMPQERSLNINTDFDFHLADLVVRSLKGVR